MIQKTNSYNFHYISLWLLFWVLSWSMTAAAIEPPKNPNSAKGCAICHYRWIDTFFVEGRATDLVPYQAEKVAADPEMCISCHDGSVMDSRDRTLHGKEHKTGVKPPVDMKIPDIFPLNDKGEVECATCHTAHGVESGPGVEETIFLRTSNKDSAMCQMCHPGKDGGPERGNHSLASTKKEIPRSLKDRWAHVGTRENQVICETCHTAHGSTSEKYLVKGAGDSGLCLECHSEQGMFSPSGKRNTNHVVNVAPREVTITAALKEKGATLGYNGIITCQTCHKIHNNQSRQPELLIADNEKSQLCLKCHPDKKRVEKTNHHLGVSAKTEENLQGQTVAEGGVCSACHLPHQAARKPYASGEYTDRTTGLCMSCHAAGKVAENEKLGGYIHPVGVKVPAAQDSGKTKTWLGMDWEASPMDLPLYNKLGVVDQSGEMTCATCHDAHGGPIVENAPPLEKGAPRIKSPLLREKSPELCRTCHAGKFAVKNSRHDLQHTFPDGNPILTQNVPKPDLCRNCHFIHTPAPDGFIWDTSTIGETGEPVYDMCTKCHHKDGLASEMLVGSNSHPVNMPLTDEIRSTRLPLFAPSGKRSDDGLVTCHTCHDPHRRSLVETANGDFVAEEGRPVNRFLRLDSAPGSQLCISCHEKQGPVIDSDHNLVETAPDAKNAAGLHPFESGVCGACHMTHNNDMPTLLWSRGLGEGDNVMDRMCHSCHQPDGVAGKKVPEIGTHPETIFIDKSRIDSIEGWTEKTFPLFDKKNAERVKSGNLSCASCHNAHRWGAGAQTAARPNAEGYATTSFLRPHVHDRVCQDCHGIESLYKYKFFHDPKKRKR